MEAGGGGGGGGKGPFIFNQRGCQIDLRDVVV